MVQKEAISWNPPQASLSPQGGKTYAEVEAKGRSLNSLPGVCWPSRGGNHPKTQLQVNITPPATWEL